jgi:hypothetical protein
MAEPIAQALEPVAPSYLVHAGRLLLERAGPRAAAFTFGCADSEQEAICETSAGVDGCG